jgi:hypothetical protein
MQRSLALAVLMVPLVFAAGCADAPADAPVEEGPVAQEAPVEEWQEFTGSFMASTHADCEVGFRDSADGLFTTFLDVDERSKGHVFQLYINVTDEVHVLSTRVEFEFDGADPTHWTFGGPPGQLIEAELPDVDGPVKAWFDVCGTTGEVSVSYRAPLFDQPEDGEEG